MSRIDGATASVAGASVAGAVLAGAMLSLDVTAGALGWWTRPVADSWCTAVQVRDQGVLSTTWQMYAHENGRLAAAAANSVSGLHNGAMERLFPALTVLLALAGSLWLYAELRRSLARRISRLAVVLLGATTTASSLLLGRSAYQSFLWAPGVITHTWPPLIAVFVVAGGLRVAGGGRARLWAPVGAAFAFVGSTFDEVTAVLLLTLAAVVLADRGVWRRDSPAWVSYVRACVIGVLAGVAVLLASPGFHSRSGGSHVTAALLAGSGADVARWLLDFLAQWPLVALVAVAVVVGFRSGLPRSEVPRVRRRMLAAPAAVVLVALVVDVVALRVGYGPTGPAITPRAFSEFFVPAVIATAFYGIVLGQVLRRRLDGIGRPLAGSHAAAVVASSLAVAAVVAGTVGLALQAHDLADVLSSRAHAWDAQNARVQHAAQADVRVVRYTPLPVAGLADPFWLAGYHDWVAGCVKSYYHVRSLRDGPSVR